MPKSFVTPSGSRRRHLLYGTAVGLLLALGASEKVYAACSAPFDGNDNVVFCTGVSSAIDALGGNDDVTLVQDFGANSADADVAGNDGNDTLTLAGGSIDDDLLGQNHDDTLIVGGFGSAAEVDGVVDGGAGSDRITIAALGSVGVFVRGGAGADTIVMTGGRGGADVLGDDGNDQITIAGGSVGDNVEGVDGDDTISIAGGEIGAFVVGNAGNDTIVMTGGGVGLDVLGGGNDDRITIAGGLVGSDVQGNDGADTLSIAGGEIGGFVLGDAGADTIVMTGGAVGSDVSGDADNDRITIAGGSVSFNVLGGGGTDTLSIGGGEINFAVLGDTGDDTVVMTGGAVGVDVRGGADNDRITIAGGSVDRDVQGNNGADTLSIAGGEIGGFVQGDAGNDTIVMTGGAVGLNVRGDADNDRITIAGGSVGNIVLGDDGADTLSIAGGEIGGVVSGDAGNDTIVMTGGAVGGNLQGGNDNDRITIAGGSVGFNVVGGGGTDTLSIGGGEIGIAVLGGVGNDTIVMTGGGVGLDVRGDDDNDRITIAGGAVGGDVLGEDGADSLFISGGSMQDVLGGDDNDVIDISGTADLQGDVISGNAGDDVMRIASVRDLSGADILGEAGNDIMELAGASGVLGGAVSLFGGSGSDDIAQFSGFAGVNAEEFGGYEQVLLLNDSTLDVHNPNAPTVNDATFGAFYSGLDTFVVYSDSSSTLFAGGTSPGNTTVIGNYANVGQISMLDGTANDLFTITGAYAGNGTGELALDAALDATELGDRFFLGTVAAVNVPALGLLVTEGTTTVIVQDVGNGIGQLTGNQAGDGIAVIDVSGGATNDDDFFLLGGPIQAGAVEYDLVRHNDNIWYLQSTFLDQVFGYAAAPSAILTMARDYMGNLRERVGSLEQTWTGGATQISDGSGVWMRGGGFFGKVDSGKDDQSFDYKQDHWFAQVGADLALLSDASTGQLIGSIMGHAGYSNTRHDENGNQLITENFIHSYGGGVALTWYGGPAGGWAGEGMYVDGIAQVTFYDLETKTEAEGKRGETDGWGWSIGLEAGYGINIGGDRNGPRLVPQIQIVYSQINLDDFTDEEGVDVEFGNADSLEGRLGVAIDSGKMWRSVNAYAEANVVHEFLGDTDVTVTTLPVDYDLGGTSVELGLGGTVSLLDNVHLYADVDYLIPFDDGRQGASVIGGLRIAF